MPSDTNKNQFAVRDPITAAARAAGARPQGEPEKKKLFTFEIGYRTYAFDRADALALMDLLDRGKKVRRHGYSSPYYLDPDGSDGVDSIVRELVVLAPLPEPEPEKPAEDSGEAEG